MPGKSSVPIFVSPQIPVLASAPPLGSGWIPLGDVPVTDGPLIVIEGSNQFTDLIEQVQAIDQSSPPARKLAYNESAVDFARNRNAHILTADYRPGDAMIFSLYTAHGSLDNCSALGRARIQTVKSSFVPRAKNG